MFEVYANTNGKSLFICNSRFGLNQCMDYCENNGVRVSYTTVDEHINPIEQFANIARWSEN